MPLLQMFGGMVAIVVGAALVAAVRIATGSAPTSNLALRALRAFGWIVGAAGWFTLLVAIGSMMGLVMWVVSLLVAGMVLRQHRDARRRAHLALLALAVEKQIPLPECVEAYAAEQGGRFARRARRFSSDLRGGVPLPDAMAESRGIFPRVAELAARVGQFCNRLGPALRDEMVSQSDYEPVRRAVASRILYLAVAFGVMPLILSFMFIKIVPVFTKIFDDFEVDLPAMTVVLIGIAASRGVQTVAAFLVPACGLGLLLAAAWYVGLPIGLPGMRWFTRRFDRATIERALAFPAEQQQPLVPMIELLADYYPSASVAARLTRAADRIERGEPWLTSLQSQLLLSNVDVAVLTAAERAGNLPWALREMAESNERRLIYRLEAVVQIGSVAMVLLIAMIVAFIAVAFFLPLVKLIMSLT